MSYGVKMLGLLFFLLSISCSALWLFMLFSGERDGNIRGIYFETFMFISIAAAAIAALFLRIGI